MAYISYIAVLLGIAGIAGGLDTGSWTSIMAATVLYIGGVIGMAATVRDEREIKNRDTEGVNHGGNGCGEGSQDRK